MISDPLNLKSGVLVSGLVSMSMAPEVSVVDMKTGEVKQISFINKSIYESILRWERLRRRYIKTKDNKDLQMWVIYPPDFDPSKKYPALLFCKGGPQAPLGSVLVVPLEYQMMAAKGYIVFAPNREVIQDSDRHGKNRYPVIMAEKISRIISMQPMQWQKSHLLMQTGWVQSGQVMADILSFIWPVYIEGRFKAFISHCGVFNFESWYGSTEELWFPE